MMLTAEGLGIRLPETLDDVRLEAQVLFNHNMANADADSVRLDDQTVLDPLEFLLTYPLDVE